MQTSTASSHLNGGRQGSRSTPTGHRIESGLPIPPREPFWKSSTGRTPTVSFDGLGVGDSIFLKAITKPALTRARANATSAAKRSGIKTTQRTVEGGLRVWRTA